MAGIENPALRKFVSLINPELAMAEVLIRRDGRGYELRHIEDATMTADSLRKIDLVEARTLAQFTATGEFRPLKSAPTLQRGWRLIASGDEELDAALTRLYPGAVADWHAAQSANPPVTNYREYTGRQSGMYRIAMMLDDAEAAQVSGEVCGGASCLKRRLWTVGGLGPDAAAAKSMIPCLEPCAILMEAARVAVRAKQERER